MWSCSIQAALHVVNGNNERMNDDESALRRASMRMPYLLQCIDAHRNSDCTFALFAQLYQRPELQSVRVVRCEQSSR